MTPIKDVPLYYIPVTFPSSHVLLHKGIKLLLHVCNFSAGVSLLLAKLTPVRIVTCV